MSPEEIIDMGYQALKIGLLIASPLLLTALITGLLVSVFQAATQINEMTLSFIPKVLMMALIGAFLAPNILDVVIDYVRTLFLAIPDNIR